MGISMNNFILFTPLILIVVGIVTLLMPKAISKFIPLLTTVTIIVLSFLNYTNSGSVSYDWLGNGEFVLTLSVSITKILFLGMILLSLLTYSIPNVIKSNDEDGNILISAGGMALAIMAGDFITLFIGWEIMSWGSYLPLLNRGRDIKAPRRYLVYSLSGAALLLVGILIIGTSSSFNFSEFVLNKQAIWALPFIMGGFLLKAGTMPLHRWVPSTYNEASDLFTGFLSGALSKAGIYGLILLATIFPHKALIYYPIMSWLGALTALFATFRAIKEDEIKKLLAWSSVAQVGYIVAAIGLNTNEGVAAGMYHAVMHTIIKVFLFTTIAGIIARTGKTRFDQLGGLIYKMPISFVAVLVGIIALAGMPPLGGFASKWVIYSALLQDGKFVELVVVIAASTAAFLYNYKLIYGIFLGHPTEVKVEDAKEISPMYIIAMIVPFILLVVTGMFPSLIYKVINPILSNMNYEIVEQGSTHVLASALGDYNGFVVMNTFAGAFFIIWALFSLVKAKGRNLHRLDIAYAAEIPTEETPLHYGTGIGHEINRIPFIGYWLQKSTKGFYKYIHSFTVSLSSVVRSIFTGDITTFFYVAIIGATLLWFLISGGK